MMSPETNGNPPSAVKRKKKGEKRLIPNIDLNVPCSNYLIPNQSPFNNSFSNVGLPDVSSTYYPVLDYSNGSELLSLPFQQRVYPHLSYSTLEDLLKLNTQKQTLLDPMLRPQDKIEETGDYMSLPTNNLSLNDNEAGKRRFSDPGLPNDSDSSNSSLESKMIQKLSNQVNLLKECNRKLSKEVIELRFEMNSLKQQVQQQTMRHFDREYEPGMLADIIKEVRDAARVREDALLARVKYIIGEKELSMSHIHLVSEKNRSNDRISKLEEQIKNLSVSFKADDSASASKSSIEDENSARQVLELEREAIGLRRELQETRAKKEEADYKVLLLDKKLSHILKRNDISTSDISDNGKTDSTDSVSMTTTSSIAHIPSSIPRVTLSGPVTDL